jgi:RNA polymerase sigma factor (sigma-70 family)
MEPMPASTPARGFPTTRWTLVLATGDQDAAGKEALEWLCQRYWQPLYEYSRWRCRNPELARDLTQDFLAALLERQWLNRADPERGRFRTYLLTSLKNFLANQFDQMQALKRGGGTASVDWQEEADNHLADEMTPEMIYEWQWALTLLSRVMDQLRKEFVLNGRAEWFDLLKPFLTGEGDYAPAAQQLSVNEGALRTTVHRLRKQFRARFLEEIAHTVTSEEEKMSEIRYMLEILARPVDAAHLDIR